MINNWKQKTWEEKKKGFKIAASIFLVFISVSFFSSPIYEKDDIKKITVTLTKNPRFVKPQNTSKVQGKPFVIFQTTSGTFELRGIDYKYLKHQQLRKNVKKGDQLTLGVLEEKVLTIHKGSVNYLQFAKAQFHKQKNRLFLRYLFTLLFFIALIPLFLKRQPMLRQNDGQYLKVDFAAILFYTFIAMFILLLMTIGFDAISSSEFIE